MFHHTVSMCDSSSHLSTTVPISFLPSGCILPTTWTTSPAWTSRSLSAHTLVYTVHAPGKVRNHDDDAGDDSDKASSSEKVVKHLIPLGESV